MTEHLRLIRYLPEYLSSTLTLHRSAIEGFALGMSREEDEADLMAVEDVYLRGEGEFLLGFLGDRLVAMGGFKRLPGDVAELRRMRIAGDVQGQGQGSRLLEELERRAIRSGVETLCLETALRRPLTLEFYRKHGYEETGRGFYGAVETVQFRKRLDSRTEHIQRSDVETVIQRQLDAYNAHDLEALVATYAADASLFEHPATLLASGVDQLRARFAQRFQEVNLHAKLLRRMVMGQFVVDHELVTRTFPEGEGTVELIATYEVSDGRIVNAWFLFGPKTLAGYC